MGCSMIIQPEVRIKQELSLALFEQAEDEAFNVQRRDICAEGHIWKHYRSVGESECVNCGKLIAMDLDED